MKKEWVFGSVIVLMFVLILASCVTPMAVSPPVSKVETVNNSREPIMEFIGFKGTSDILASDYESWQSFKKNTSLTRLGAYLQKNNIAFDQSYAYFGIYSLQEIAQYKNHVRYITFVEVEKNTFTVTVSNASGLWGGIGAGFLTCGLLYNYLGSVTENQVYSTSGVIFDIAGVAGLAVAFIPPKSSIYFNGRYNIYVYDTKSKEIVYKDTIQAGPYLDKYKGSYYHENTNRDLVHDFYATFVYDKIIAKYSEVNQFLRTRDN